MNIARLIQEQAERHPDKKAVVMTVAGAQGNTYPYYTFAQFERRSQQIAARLSRKGVKVGDRVLLFVRPSLDFSVITFALFKLGAVPVLIDPGMGRKNLLRAIKEVRPVGLIGVNLVHLLRRIFIPTFSSVKWAFSTEKNILLAPHLFNKLDAYPADISLYDAKDTDPAAILFTSGGTGTPKGVVTTHGILRAQTEMLRDLFSLNENEIDMPGFPLFALFTLAMGMTSVIPDMDPTRPAHCDPAKLVRTLLEQNISFAAGSPAIWERVGRFCREQKITLPKLKYVVMFGAPVRGEIHEMWAPILTEGTTYTPYGATECLPVSCISGKEILSETWEKTKKGAGVCIGKASSPNEVFIIKATDIPKSELNELATGEIGEIVVRGSTVTPGYFERDEATRLAKIATPQGLAHCMGDVGYKDAEGRVWFCGRKNHVVNGFYPIQVEAIFNQHPLVLRSALVHYKKRPSIVVELKVPTDENKIKAELKALGQQSEYAKEIQDFFVHKDFPVDVRHNIKIDREALGRQIQEAHQ